MTPQNVDEIIYARWILTLDDDDRVLENYCLVIQGGRIIDLLPEADAKERYQGATHTRLPDQALIPGLVNTHTHAAMSLLRGLADDLPLMTWLNEHIWPAEGRWVSEEFVHDGTQLALAEMIRGGTTCFNDMYFFPEITGRAAAAAGMRTTIGLIVLDSPSAWADSPEQYLSKGLEVHDHFRSHGLITTAFAPHAPYSVSDAPLERIRVLADELDIPIHMHVHETRDEITGSLQQYGVRPLERLHDLDLLSPALLGVHMTQLEPREIESYATTGAQVVHCPESNLKLASGFSPVASLLEAGINVAIGTDGAASNNDLDMFSELRTAALLAKGVAKNASALPAATALRMATGNGARALGLDSEIGSLEIGKSADVVAVDLTGCETQPVYNPVSHLVYAAGRDKVSNVWVHGKRLLQDGQLTTLDMEEILTKAREWGERINR